MSHRREVTRHGLTPHAVARGIRPETGIPGAGASGLARDEIEVPEFQACDVLEREFLVARPVTAINVKPSDLVLLHGSVENWSVVPAVSVDRAAAWHDFELRVTQLLGKLARTAGLQ